MSAIEAIKHKLSSEYNSTYDRKDFDLKKDWLLVPGDTAYDLGVKKGRSDLAKEINELIKEWC